jgi:hypothetical protein
MSASCHVVKEFFWNDLSGCMTRFRFLLATTVGCFVIPGCAHAPAGAPAPDPALARGIAIADSLIESSIGTLIPGAVFLVSRDGRVVHERAFGYAQLNDYEGHRLASPPVMRTSTMFDLASVTKVMATTMATMLLVSGSIDLDAPVYRYLRIFEGRTSTASPSGICSRIRRGSCNGSRFTTTPTTAPRPTASSATCRSSGASVTLGTTAISVSCC